MVCHEYFHGLEGRGLRVGAVKIASLNRRSGFLGRGGGCRQPNAIYLTYSESATCGEASGRTCA